MLQVINKTTQIGIVASDPRFFLGKRKNDAGDISRFNFLLCTRDAWNIERKVYIYVNTYGWLAELCNEAYHLKNGDLVIVDGHIGSYMRSRTTDKINKYTHKVVIFADVVLPMQTRGDYEGKLQKVWVEKEQGLKKIVELEMKIEKLKKQLYSEE